MHRLALIGALLLLAGCAQQNPLLVGSVSGTVVASPCRPVERAGDPPCPAVGGVTVEFGTARAVTNAAGVYSVHLPPGTYPIKVKAGAWERPATPASVSVSAGAAIVLNLNYDSGIR